MKSIYKIKFILLLLAVVCGLWTSSCKEIGPDIDLGNSATDTTLLDSTYLITAIPAAQEKMVVLEEFTGVRCINCPDGHEQIYNILNTYPNSCIAISLHSDFLGVAYPGQPELRIEEAQDLEELLGPAAAKPMAAIDRVLFSGESFILQFLQQWSGRVSQQTGSAVPVNIEIDNRIESGDLIVKAKLTYLQNVNLENRITVLLTEDSVVAAQLTNTIVDSNYIHNHLARGFLTRYNGTVLNYDLKPGRVIEKEFKYSAIHSSWKMKDMKAIVLVHQYGSQMNILQAAEKKLLP
jgi:hypothetical protein